MTPEMLTAILAERAMGWSVSPDRFLLGGKRWLPRWRFRPLEDLADAFQLLDRVSTDWTLTRDIGGFTAEVRIGCIRGKRPGSRKRGRSLSPSRRCWDWRRTMSELTDDFYGSTSDPKAEAAADEWASGFADKPPIINLSARIPGGSPQELDGCGPTLPRNMVSATP